MIKVLANDGISEIGVQILEENGFEVIPQQSKDEYSANHPPTQ
jgi:hypothetical protein